MKNSLTVLNNPGAVEWSAISNERALVRFYEHSNLTAEAHFKFEETKRLRGLGSNEKVISKRV